MRFASLLAIWGFAAGCAHPVPVKPPVDSGAAWDAAQVLRGAASLSYVFAGQFPEACVPLRIVSALAQAGADAAASASADVLILPAVEVDLTPCGAPVVQPDEVETIAAILDVLDYSARFGLDFARKQPGTDCAAIAWADAGLGWAVDAAKDGITYGGAAFHVEERTVWLEGCL